MASFLKICSMNVRGITDSIKRKDVFNWLKDKNYSIYCLQDYGSSELPKFFYFTNLNIRVS